MLQEVSKHYDAEVEYAVKSLSEAIGPILTVGLAAVVGFFALAHRVVRLPLSVIGDSIGQVFFQQASEDYVNKGNCIGVFDMTAKKLFYLAFPIFLILHWLACNSCLYFAKK